MCLASLMVACLLLRPTPPAVRPTRSEGRPARKASAEPLSWDRIADVRTSKPGCVTGDVKE